MNSRLKRRLVVVTGVIVIVILVVLATVASMTASKDITVAQAVSGEYSGVKVQVTGKVVDGSYSLDGNVLSFSIYEDVEETGGVGQGAAGTAGTANANTANANTADAGAAPSAGANTTRPTLRVTYDQGVSSTFGNQVTAICTGTINQAGVLECTTLVTKCPSKYENATDAFEIAQLLSYGDQIVGKPVKVAGTLQAGTLTSSLDAGPRFVISNGVSGDELPVYYDGGLSGDVEWEGSTVVLTGSLDSQGRFEATDVALRG